jgi:hypothetical protein
LKVAKLDKDEKILTTERTGRGRRNMLFVTEPGLYSIILTCRGATTPGTPAHAFRRWVTHEVLPSIRKDREYKLRESLAAATHEEKGRRLWIVIRDMDIWNYNVRRKYFGKVCKATKQQCYLDEFNSPHVKPDELDACKACIRILISKAILKAVPANQSLVTDFFSGRSS